ncbi:MAG TPA: hypothetical protein VHB48_05335 [Chitinophagaceae bacterium]|jgi:hypothetical protein|nr:hypothetical protein [Chitinophagaceae bacterium]
MSCALTQGFNLDCRDAVGGLKEIYITELGSISSVTEASGTISAITNASGKQFWKYSLIRETSNAEETITGNEQNGTIFYAQKVDVILNKRQVSVRNEILLLAKNKLAIVAVDNIGNAWLYGRVNGLMLNAGTSPTGTAWGDRNGYTLTFSGNETELAPMVQASVIATLETPGT